MVAGITGGIGSGKSTVARLFKLLGWTHYNSDTVAKSLYYLPEIKQQVIQLLGPQAYTADGQPDKSFIGSRVFEQAELLKQLNAILHPAVGKHFNDFCEKHAQVPILKESALLFEAGLHAQMNKIVLVVAPDEIRIQRVIERDGLSREEVLSKMKHQMPQEEKMKKAHVIIVNDEKQSLIEQVLEANRELLNQSPFR